MIHRATHAPAHLRSDFDDFALDLTTRHGLHERQPRPPRSRIPSRSPQLVPVLEFGIQALKLHQADPTVVRDEHSLISGQATTAVADARAQEVRAQTVVEPNALCDLD